MSPLPSILLKTINDILQSEVSDSSELKDDTELLKDWGKTLRDIDRTKIIKNKNLIYDLEKNLKQYFIKLEKERKLSDTIETDLINLRGKAAGLGQSTDEEDFNDEYFIRVFSLGNSLYKLCKLIPVSTIGAIIGVISSSLSN